MLVVGSELEQFVTNIKINGFTNGYNIISGQQLAKLQKNFLFNYHFHWPYTDYDSDHRLTFFDE